MSCSELENLSSAYLDGELLDAEKQPFEAHLASCDRCRARVETERATLTLIRTRAQEGQPRAPEALRLKLSAALASERRGERRSQAARWSAAAAGLVVCAALAQHGYRRFERQRYVDDVVSRHARQFPLEIERPNPAQLEAWFGGKLDHRVAVPRFLNTVTAGGRLLNVREHQAAYIRFDAPRPGGDRHMGLFVYGDKPGDVDVGTLKDAELGQSNGYNVVSWREGDVVYQLVTDLDEGDIRQLMPPQGGPAAVTPVSFEH